jgi:hypothetical protein
MSGHAAPLAWAQVIARNVVPLGGILLLGWNAASVLVLYFVDTVLAMSVLFAGALRQFAPPVADDGWAARVNGEAGMVAGGLFLATFISVPLAFPLFLMLGGDVSLRELVADPALRAGIVWQAIAAFWSYVGLYRALRYATADELRLKRRFALVFLRWIAVMMVAMLGIGLLLGRYSPVLFVAIYIGVTIWAEIAPDRFLRVMPGGAEDADGVSAASGTRADTGPRSRDKRRERRRR